MLTLTMLPLQICMYHEPSARAVSCQHVQPPVTTINQSINLPVATYSNRVATQRLQPLRI